MDPHYETLNLKPGAAWEEVRQAYRDLVKFWHPDRFPSVPSGLQQLATRKLKEINAAYGEIEKSFSSRGEILSSSAPPPPPVKPSVARREQVSWSWPNGDRYEGETRKGLMHGRGTYYYSRGGRYEGEFENGKPHGRGTLFYTTGDVFDGEFRSDTIEGRGTYSYANGDKFIGWFQQGQPHGRGCYVLANGKQFTGHWDNGDFLGE
ncbi:MAG: DnaJ domain-containing protein [Nitrospinaceae bacterium]